ncbi:hypothetical protein [Bradyrhizobium neotropicale]|uniref:hypothetical protein n=1 Tax=Bradyrhizobium neotropicale TaxID=1497615 RepID=UPI001FEE0A71|nr:hypothetical protein [Bradyrhizobium neotropicale]
MLAVGDGIGDGLTLGVGLGAGGGVGVGVGVVGGRDCACAEPIVPMARQSAAANAHARPRQPLTELARDGRHEQRMYLIPKRREPEKCEKSDRYRPICPYFAGSVNRAARHTSPEAATLLSIGHRRCRGAPIFRGTPKAC